jgi:hypothetical protein
MSQIQFKHLHFYCNGTFGEKIEFLKTQFKIKFLGQSKKSLKKSY